MATRSLPEGTVTFAFSDVEGSTRLMERGPAAMGRALARHHELLESAVETHDGVVFETVGDAVYAAFSTADSGVAAGIAMQRALQAEDWGPDGRLRIRIAIHSGAVERRGDHYFGPALFTCARLQALAHGQQTLASGTTTVLLDEGPGSPWTLQPLGRHRLKDLNDAIDVVQVGARDLPDRFPPLRSSGFVPTNIQAPGDRFIGRDEELELLTARLGDHRLVTLLGPGGTGKTRLALQLALGLRDRFPDGVFFVDLARLSEPSLIAGAIADVLGVRLEPGVEVEPQLRDHVARFELMLVLDNWEHLLAGSGIVPALLSAAPRLRILATSRVPLRIAGEQRVRIHPLPTPSTSPAGDRTALDHEGDPGWAAVRMFVDRARDADPAFELDAANAPDVVELCRRLDGLPLAIELAAARMDVLTPHAMLRSISAGEDVMVPGFGGPARHRDLDEVIDWSLRLLSADQASLLAAIGVFARSVTPDGAAAVSGQGPEGAGSGSLGALVALADASLVQRVPDSNADPRFGMLETIRTAAIRRLASHGEESAARSRHARWAAGLAEAYESGINGPESIRWGRRMEDEIEELLAAGDWALGHGEAETAARIIGSTPRLWQSGTFGHQGMTLAKRTLDLSLSARWRGKVLNCMGQLQLWNPGDLGAALGWFGEAHRLLTDAGTLAEIADAQLNIGVQHYMIGDLDASEDALLLAVDAWQSAGDVRGEAIAVDDLAEVHLLRGDAARAQTLIERAVDLARTSGNPHVLVLCRCTQAQVSLAMGKFDDVTAAARLAMLRDNLRIADLARDHHWVNWNLRTMAASTSHVIGEAARASRLLGASDAVAGDWVRREPPVAAMSDAIERRCVDALGRAMFDATYLEGRQVTRAAAMAYALGEEDPFDLGTRPAG